jgi:hypothetical protein
MSILHLNIHWLFLPLIRLGYLLGTDDPTEGRQG